MANCMTCRHNDKKTKYCLVKKAHTDLGYVLNCIAWTPTDEAEMKRLHAENAKLREQGSRLFDKTLELGTENAKLRELAAGLRQCLNWESCKGCPMHDKAGWCTRDNRLREMGIEVD